MGWQQEFQVLDLPVESAVFLDLQVPSNICLTYNNSLQLEEINGLPNPESGRICDMYVFFCFIAVSG
jgi:hypothetical protein